MEIYLIALVIMSLITFIFYGIDKKRAQKNKWRIKEATLLGLSLFLGSIGGLCGLYILRHKTKHWYFVVVNFMALIIHIVVFIYILKNVGFVLI